MEEFRKSLIDTLNLNLYNVSKTFITNYIPEYLEEFNKLTGSTRRRIFHPKVDKKKVYLELRKRRNENYRKNKNKSLDHIILRFYEDVIRLKDFVPIEYYTVALYVYHYRNRDLIKFILQMIEHSTLAELYRIDPFEPDLDLSKLTLQCSDAAERRRVSAVSKRLDSLSITPDPTRVLTKSVGNLSVSPGRVPTYLKDLTRIDNLMAEDLGKHMHVPEQFPRKKQKTEVTEEEIEQMFEEDRQFQEELRVIEKTGQIFEALSLKR